ncbi:MAG: hypothetical protein EXS29_07475 [Pedosphaera sp.]|nr:hypothetical protein [Pedosphaera sp.]
MLQSLILASVVLACAPALNAQGAQIGRAGAGGGVYFNLEAQLDLSKEQTAALAKVRKEQQEKTSALFTNKELKQEERTKLWQELRTESEKEVNAIYTEAQRKKLVELEAQQQRKWNEFRYTGMSTELGLIDDQMTKLAAVAKAQEERSRAIFQDGTLDRKQRQDKWAALTAEFRDKADKVFTAEQLAKITKHRGEQQRKADMAQVAGYGIDFELNEDQRKQVNLLAKEMTRAMNEIYAEKDLPGEEKAAKYLESQKKLRAKFTEILNDEQRKRYIVEQEILDLGWIFGGQTRQLDLTADQRGKIKTLRKEHADKTREIFADKESSQEVKTKKASDLNAAHNLTLEALLTEAQTKKLKEELRPNPGTGLLQPRTLR